MFLCSGNIFPGVNPTNHEELTGQHSFTKASSTSTNTGGIYLCHSKYFGKRSWLTALIHSRGVTVALCGRICSRVIHMSKNLRQHPFIIGSKCLNFHYPDSLQIQKVKCSILLKRANSETSRKMYEEVFCNY